MSGRHEPIVGRSAAGLNQLVLRSRILVMTAGTDPVAVRAAALAWLGRVTLDGEVAVSRDQLAGDFMVDGSRFPLIDRGRGIRKPAGWDAALSITTSVPKSGRARPYDDAEGIDGLRRYKLRRDDGGRAANCSTAPTRPASVCSPPPAGG
jgi:hypothetical protein